MTEQGKEVLRETLLRNARGAEEKMAESNLLAAFEEFYVALTVSRVALNTDPEYLTPEYVNLTRRMAWALADLEVGDGARVADDLETVESLAENVQHRERGHD